MPRRHVLLVPALLAVGMTISSSRTVPAPLATGVTITPDPL